MQEVNLDEIHTATQVQLERGNAIIEALLDNPIMVSLGKEAPLDRGAVSIMTHLIKKLSNQRLTDRDAAGKYAAFVAGGKAWEFGGHFEFYLTNEMANALKCFDLPDGVVIDMGLSISVLSIKMGHLQNESIDRMIHIIQIIREAVGVRIETKQTKSLWTH